MRPPMVILGFAERAEASVGTAFDVISGYAQTRHRTMTDIAHRVVDDDPDVADVVPRPGGTTAQ